MGPRKPDSDDALRDGVPLRDGGAGDESRITGGDVAEPDKAETSGGDAAVAIVLARSVPVVLYVMTDLGEVKLLPKGGSCR